MVSVFWTPLYISYYGVALMLRFIYCGICFTETDVSWQNIKKFDLFCLFLDLDLIYPPAPFQFVVFCSVDGNQYHLESLLRHFVLEQTFWVTYWQERKPDFAKLVWFAQNDALQTSKSLYLNSAYTAVYSRHIEGNTTEILFLRNYPWVYSFINNPLAHTVWFITLQLRVLEPWHTLIRFKQDIRI